MNNKHFIPQNFIDVHKFSKQAPITGVFLIVSDDTGYMAGTEGNVLQVECPSGTQAMANDLLVKAQGHQYQGYEAPSVKLPFAAELGDGVSVGGFYGLLADQTLELGGGDLSDISAPGEDEIDHAYPYVSREQRAVERKLAQTEANVIATLDSIELSVVTVDKKNYIRLTGEGIETSDINCDGVFRARSVYADNISGNVVNISDSAVFYDDDDDEVGSIGSTSQSGVALCSSAGAGLKSDSGAEVIAGSSGVTLENANNGVIRFYSGGFYPTSSVNLGVSSNKWATIWVETGAFNTSDRKAKKDINYDNDKYSAFFDKLKPCNYKMVNGTSGRTHTGFIAQDVEEALFDCAISTQDFAGFAKDGDVYALRYDEFIALCVDQIQKLKKRVEELEEKLNG